jgi:hypothetical protein
VATFLSARWSQATKAAPPVPIGLQFWTADKQQAHAARSEGLVVEWIEDGASRG